MSVARLSPSSNLLRGSRLFAVPKPLPSALQNASSQPVAHSETATSPYPTHAAIETPTDALHRGEWGLKRALPLKSTVKTGTPYIRVKDGIDTIEHITNFEPAADHVLTLKKFQTLHSPVLLPDERGAQGPNPGGLFSTPFEDRYHSTSKSNLRNAKRWTTEGPWVAGQTSLEFETFLKTQVKNRKKDFREFLRQTLIVEKIHQKLAQLALEQSSENKDIEVQISEETKTRVAEDVANELKSDESSLDAYIKTLRANPARFTPLIQAFFDLPDTPQRGRDNNGESFAWKLGNSDFKTSSIASPSYREMGMPSTHPSAGLGYLRLASYATNHPVYGPQSQADPIPARILKPGAKMVADNRRRAKLGAAGFVTDQYQEGFGHAADERATSQLREFVPQPGGSKYPVRPSKVHIAPDGRAVMETMATRADKVVMAGLREETPLEQYIQQRRHPAVQPLGEQMPRLDGNYSGTGSGSATARKEIDQRISDALRSNRQGLNSLLSGERARERPPPPPQQQYRQGQRRQTGSPGADLVTDMIRKLGR